MNNVITVAQTRKNLGLDNFSIFKVLTPFFDFMSARATALTYPVKRRPQGPHEKQSGQPVP